MLNPKKKVDHALLHFLSLWVNKLHYFFHFFMFTHQIKLQKAEKWKKNCLLALIFFVFLAPKEFQDNHHIYEKTDGKVSITMWSKVSEPEQDQVCISLILRLNKIRQIIICGNHILNDYLLIIVKQPLILLYVYFI